MTTSICLEKARHVHNKNDKEKKEIVGRLRKVSSENRDLKKLNYFQLNVESIMDNPCPGGICP